MSTTEVQSVVGGIVAYEDAPPGMEGAAFVPFSAPWISPQLLDSSLSKAAAWSIFKSFGINFSMFVNGGSWYTPSDPNPLPWPESSRTQHDPDSSYSGLSYSGSASVSYAQSPVDIVRWRSSKTWGELRDSLVLDGSGYPDGRMGYIDSLEFRLISPGSATTLPNDGGWHSTLSGSGDGWLALIGLAPDPWRGLDPPVNWFALALTNADHLRPSGSGTMTTDDIFFDAQGDDARLWLNALVRASGAGGSLHIAVEVGYESTFLASALSAIDPDEHPSGELAIMSFRPQWADLV
jgi:hypothetical protein